MKQKTLFTPKTTSKPQKVTRRKVMPKRTVKRKITLDKAVISLINRKQRQVLLHSYIYYELDKNIISDHVFDEWCFELVKLMNNYPNENKKSEFYNDFKGFDGSTGMDLTYRQPWTIKWAGIFLDPKFRINGGH